jgi:triosephosphate isomerase
VERQLSVLNDHDPETLERIVIAYEPVWAIGTGKTATPADASEVHAHIRTWLAGRGADPQVVRVLYGGSVKPVNIRSLVAEPEVDGVLVGGASLEPESWAAISQTPVD